MSLSFHNAVTHKKTIIRSESGQPDIVEPKMPDPLIATRIANIKNEVEEFHPILLTLLPKLPHVRECEYTHGQREMGADFIIERANETLGDIEYIGVIAKVGKILQDLGEIERQIEECEIDRLFGAGKKKIALTGIWVVSNDVISKGAQEKIHHKYKIRNIQFIPGSKLVKFIETHLPNYGATLPVELGDYLHGIKTANAEMDKRLALFQAKDGRFYIEQDIYPNDAETYKNQKKAQQRVDLQDEIQKHKLVCIEGSMGSGKSKLLRQIVDHYSDGKIYAAKKVLPLLIPFTRFIEKYDGDAARAIEAELPQKVQEQSVDATKLLLIDGLDERNTTSDDQPVYLKKIAASIAGDNNLKVVLTSRYSNAMEASPEANLIGRSYELRQLSMARLLEFLKALCAAFDVKSRLVQDIQNSSLFKQLPRSPIAAILLAQLLQQNSKELPSSLTELYSKYMELMLGRWDVEKGLQSQKEHEALENILTRIAEFMMTNELPKISADEALRFFREYLTERNLGLDAEQLFAKMVQRCEIVAVDSRAGLFFFKHRTFMEFFFAKRCQKTGLGIDSRVWNPYWANSYFFYIGLKKDCPELLRAIAKIKPTHEGEAILRLINTPNYLLAGFSTPYNVIEEIVEDAFIDAAKYYAGLVEKPAGSIFSEFPRMRILWMVQYMIRKGYAYDYFRKALASSAERIDARGSDVANLTALFFIGVVGIELKTETPLDLILEKQRPTLPIDLQLAMRHEISHSKLNTSSVKKFERQVKRMMRSNPRLRAQVPLFYDLPVNRAAKRLSGPDKN